MDQATKDFLEMTNADTYYKRQFREFREREQKSQEQKKEGK